MGIEVIAADPEADIPDDIRLIGDADFDMVHFLPVTDIG